jgi:Zn-dependent protease
MSGILDLFQKGYIIEALLFVVAAVLSIMLHELAHGYAAVKNGDLTPRIANRMNLNPLNHFDPIGFAMFLFIGFGWAKPVPVNPNNFNNYRRGLFQVSVAGVALNYLIAFVSFPLMSVFYTQFYLSANIIFNYLFWFFRIMFLLNLVLCVFNLLPVYPLDGFRILESRLRRINPYIDFMYRYGMYILIAVLLIARLTPFNLLGVLSDIAGWPIEKFWGLFGL